MNKKNESLLKEKKVPRKEQILKFIIKYIEENGYSPTVREIGDGVGLKSTSSIHFYLSDMFSSGVLETNEKVGAPRAIRVPGYKFVKMSNDLDKNE